MDRFRGEYYVISCPRCGRYYAALGRDWRCECGSVGSMSWKRARGSGDMAILSRFGEEVEEVVVPGLGAVRAAAEIAAVRKWVSLEKSYCPCVGHDSGLKSGVLICADRYEAALGLLLELSEEVRNVLKSADERSSANG